MRAPISLLLPLTRSFEVCNDLDYWNECNEQCKKSNGSCLEKCYGLACEHDCSMDLVVCMESCPCMKDCPNGCDDYCMDARCVCGIPEENVDFVRCFEEVTALFEECFLACPNQECLLQCKAIYESNLNQCPCQLGCPDGCPCPHYSCPHTTKPTTTTTTKTQTTTATTTASMTSTATTTATTPFTTTSTTSTSTQPAVPALLVLNTWKASSKPFLVQPNGNLSTNVSFLFGSKTEVYQSCSVTFQGEMYVFGGKSESTQISKIEVNSLHYFSLLSTESGLSFEC